MEEEVKIANSEIFEILSYMDKQQVMKIPVSLLENFKNNRQKDYISRIDKNDIYNKNNISKRALRILAYLNVNYWVDENKKAELVEQYRKNDIKNMEKLKEEYPIDIFENRKTEEKQIEQQIMQINKENIFKNLWNKILKFFKRG